jgi:hypothetical protein
VQLKGLISVVLVVAAAAFIAVWLSAESRAETADRSSLNGAWTLNKDLSDQPMDRGERGDRDRGRGNGGGFGGRRGGGGGFGGRGGFGGGGMGRGQGQGAMNPEDMARTREAMRDIMNPSDRLTITETDSMVIITAADGRTTRLSPDGKKIKDDNTKMERKTKWDGDKLVSEISGLGPGKMTQSFAVDSEHHQLRVTIVMEGGTRGGQSGQPRTITHVYDADSR